MIGSQGINSLSRAAGDEQIQRMQRVNKDGSQEKEQEGPKQQSKKDESEADKKQDSLVLEKQKLEKRKAETKKLDKKIDEKLESEKRLTSPNPSGEKEQKSLTDEEEESGHIDLIG